MNYRHYYTTPKLDNDQSYYGAVSGLPEAGMIHGTTIEEFEENFHQAVDEAIRAKDERKSARTRRGLIWGLSLIALLVVMAITCPEKEKHVTAVSDALSVLINDQMSDDTDDLEMFGAMLGNKLVGAVLKNNMYIDNYVLFNVGKMSFNGEEQAVSLGMFNHVFTTSREKIRERAKNNEDVQEFLNMF